MEQWIQAPGLALVSAEDVAAARGKDAGGKLTVTLWVAKDRRMLIAGAREVA